MNEEKVDGNGSRPVEAPAKGDNDPCAKGWKEVLGRQRALRKGRMASIRDVCGAYGVREARRVTNGAVLLQAGTRALSSGGSRNEVARLAAAELAVSRHEDWLKSKEKKRPLMLDAKTKEEIFRRIDLRLLGPNLE